MKGIGGLYSKAAAGRLISIASLHLEKGVPEAMDVLPAARAAQFKSMAPTALNIVAHRREIVFARTWILR